MTSTRFLWRCPGLSLRRTPLQTLGEMSPRQDYASNPAKLWFKAQEERKRPQIGGCFQA